MAARSASKSIPPHPEKSEIVLILLQPWLHRTWDFRFGACSVMVRTPYRRLGAKGNLNASAHMVAGDADIAGCREEG